MSDSDMAHLLSAACRVFYGFGTFSSQNDVPLEVVTMVDEIPEQRGRHDRPDMAPSSGRDEQGRDNGDDRSDLEARVGAYAPTARRIAAIVAHELGKRGDDEQIRQCAGDAMRDLLARPEPVRGMDRWCRQATLRRYLDQVAG